MATPGESSLTDPETQNSSASKGSPDEIPNPKSPAVRSSTPDLPDGNQNNGHNSLCEHCQVLILDERKIRNARKNSRNKPEPPQNDCFENVIKSWVVAKELTIPYVREDIVPTFPSITATAEGGCSFCQLLLAGNWKKKCLSAHQSSGAHTVKIASVSYYWFYTAGGPPVLTTLTPKGSFEDKTGKPVASMSLWPFCWIEKGDSRSRYTQGIDIKAFPPAQSLFSEEGLTMMRRWVSRCEKACQHSLSIADVHLPTRLVDVGSDRLREDTVRLVHTSDTSGITDWRYAALSHCWGPPIRPPLKTTSNLLEKHLRKIPTKSLPRNYRDAVRVTRALGLQFLWIDSICIIQDRLEDWEAESARMHEIYQHAHVTLIAAQGDSCHDGMLNFDVAPTAWIPFEVSNLDGKSNGYYLRDFREVPKEIEQSSWSKRAWTFQEGRFATRKLYFTASSVSYTCGDSKKIQLANGMAVPFEQNANGIATIQFAQHLLQDDDPDLVNKLYRSLWFDHIEGYSKRLLSVTQDRLSAVSSWASMLSKMRDCQYLAGLWRENLHLWLLWRCKGYPCIRSHTERVQFASQPDFVAPSWSWASYMQAVEWSLSWGGPYNSECEITGAETIPSSSQNPFGRLISGHLRISGKVACMPRVGFHRQIWSLSPSLIFSGSIHREGHDGEAAIPHQIDLFLDWWEARMDVERSEQEVPFSIFQDLLMFQLVSSGGEPNRNRRISYGLLLLSTGRDGEYWRVGTFNVASEEGEIFWDFEEDCTVTII